VSARRASVCPHCGASLEEPAREEGAAPAPHRYDLEKMAAIAEREKAYDETVKVRVTQEDIRKLVQKRRKGPK
jgi:uncharacterized protein with PIN domain